MSELTLANAEETEAAGGQLARRVLRADDAPLCIFLHGELGAGKTTFTRGFLRGLGYSGRVPSPTYTLVEPYEIAGRSIWHLDLYRLGSGAELEYLGISEMAATGSVLLIEWPERAAGFLPDSDLEVTLKVISAGRAVLFEAHSAAGRSLLDGAADDAGVAGPAGAADR